MKPRFSLHRARLQVATTVIGSALATFLCEPLVDGVLQGEKERAAVRALAMSVDVDRHSVKWDIPIHRTEAVESWIEFHSSDPGRRLFQEWLNRMTEYEEPIRRKLRRRGMPEDLVYIALIESGFDPMAVSSAKATGLWQFMGRTARERGLLVTRYVDERLDPIRSTTAAIDFLESLQRRFGSWYLAAAAYNAGPGLVHRVLDAHGGDGPRDEALFWTISPHLPRETQQYVPRLIAAAIMAKDPSRFGFRPQVRDPRSFETVFTPGETSLRDVAAGAGVSYEEVRALNPHLLRGVTPPDLHYPVRIPAGTAHLVTAALSERSVGTSRGALTTQ